jgi:hypothetical protein
MVACTAKKASYAPDHGYDIDVIILILFRTKVVHVVNIDYVVSIL